MRFDEWLDGERGRATKVAEFFGVTPSAVSQWRTNGVPVANIIAVHELTDKEVSLEELLAREPAGKTDAASLTCGTQQLGQAGARRQME